MYIRVCTYIHTYNVYAHTYIHTYIHSALEDVGCTVRNRESMRADARRRITLYSQTQVSLQGTGSEPLGLGPSSSVENRNSLACLPGYEREK